MNVQPVKAESLSWSAWLGDVWAIGRQIGYMAFVKRHFRAAWTMLRMFPTLVRLRRSKVKPEHASPFVYVMQ